MSYGSREYRMAQALVVFTQAWDELVAASKACPDLDVSELYPFYLLDYEELAQPVKAWCVYHASTIMKQVPDKVYNPECFACPYVGQGLDEQTGLCKGYASKKCGRHPYIMFTVDAVRPFLAEHGISIEGLSPETIQLLYVRKVEQG